MSDPRAPGLDIDFSNSVWDALKGDHNDLRRQAIILQAHRAATAHLLTQMEQAHDV